MRGNDVTFSIRASDGHAQRGLALQMEQKNEENLISRRLDGSGLHHHLDLVFGAREQLDGSGLAEPGSVHLIEYGTLVGLDPERDGDVDEVRDAVHVAALGSRKRDGGCAVLMRRRQAGPRDHHDHFRDAHGSQTGAKGRTGPPVLAQNRLNITIRRTWN